MKVAFCEQLSWLCLLSDAILGTSKSIGKCNVEIKSLIQLGKFYFNGSEIEGAHVYMYFKSVLGVSLLAQVHLIERIWYLPI